jgi:ParB family chromosome partitioning protein
MLLKQLAIVQGGLGITRDVHANSCKFINIKDIKVDPDHIRKTTSSVTDLKFTVSDVGLLQPILVRKTDDHYTVIDGERRLRAVKELAISDLIVGREVIIDEDETDADARFKQIIANIQREDINDIDLGFAFVTLKEKYGYQYKETAEIIGKTPHFVTSKVGLVKRLIPDVQEMVISDWEKKKCIRDTFSAENNPAGDAYDMNIKIIEDIARLPKELQKTAFLNVQANKMDNSKALKYLRAMKKQYQNNNVAEEAGYPMGSYGPEVEANVELLGYVEKIVEDVDAFASRLKGSDLLQQDDLLYKLESAIEKMNQLYTKLKQETVPADYKAQNKALV